MAGKKVEHVGIMVSNLEKSIAFYETIVGMTHKSTMLHTDGVIRLAFLGFRIDGETEVELVEGYTGKLAIEGRVHHVAITVDDIEAELVRIRGLNVPQIDEEITTLPNGARYFFFAGPDGEWIEFFQREGRR